MPSKHIRIRPRNSGGRAQSNVVTSALLFSIMLVTLKFSLVRVLIGSYVFGTPVPVCATVPICQKIACQIVELIRYKTHGLTGPSMILRAMPYRSSRLKRSQAALRAALLPKFWHRYRTYDPIRTLTNENFSVTRVYRERDDRRSRHVPRSPCKGSHWKTDQI